MLGKTLLVWLTGAILIFSAAAPAHAENALAVEGIKAYNAKQYKVALAKLSACLKAEPGNSRARYYLALCYQNLCQFQTAKQQFEWLATHDGSPVMQGLARTALAELKAAAPTATASATPTAQQPADASPAKAPPKPVFRGKKLLILDFYTPNCAPCRLFEPIWESVSSRMGTRADFKRVNAMSGDKLASQYGQYASGYPSVVWINAQTEEVIQTTGWFNSDEDFLEAFEYIGKKVK